MPDGDISSFRRPCSRRVAARFALPERAPASGTAQPARPGFPRTPPGLLPCPSLGSRAERSPDPQGLLPHRCLCYTSLAPHPLHRPAAAERKEAFPKRIWFRFDTENCLIRYKSPKAGRGFDKTKEVPLRLLTGGGGVFFFHREK